MPANGPCGPENGGMPFSGLGTTPGGAPSGKPDLFSLAFKFLEQLALKLEFGKEAFVDVPAAVSNHRRKETCLGVTRIVPTGVGRDRIPADAAEIGAAPDGLPDLVADVVKP